MLNGAIFPPNKNCWVKFEDLNRLCQQYVQTAADTISYPLFVHVIRKDIYGGVPYHMRPEAECDTAPHHRYLPYYVEQTGDNEFII